MSKRKAAPAESNGKTSAWPSTTVKLSRAVYWCRAPSLPYAASGELVGTFRTLIAASRAIPGSERGALMDGDQTAMQAALDAAHRARDLRNAQAYVRRRAAKNRKPVIDPFAQQLGLPL